MSDAIREAFEAWFSGWGRTPKAVIESLREGEEYPQESMREVNAAWHAWQSALQSQTAPAPRSVAVPEGCPDDIRALGLSVAVHNDYRLNGEHHTFWLFTDATGMSHKGEGRTDAEALNKVRAILAAAPAPDHTGKADNMVDGHE